jgi:DNA invertase Pin-like site-specific DNA recombinase
VKRTAERAGVYVRISQDRAGDELGIERQKRVCEALAEDRGWTVAGVYADDDVSAFKPGRKRPGFERLKGDLESGAITAVIAVDQDRIARRLGELVAFLELLEKVDAPVVTTAGDLDSSTADGKLKLHILGAVAENESRKKSERIRRQREQMALTGNPQGGGRRAFGYDPSGANLVDAEARLVREACDRYLSGESLRAIALEWNARGIKTSTGKAWGITSLRQVLGGTRIAGLRVYRREVVGVGTWPAIITRVEHDAIRARLGNPREHKVGRPPLSLLGGMIVCGRCGSTMHASRYPNGTRRYACGQAPGKNECGGVAIQGEKLEGLVVEVVMQRLDTPALAKALAAPKASKAVDVDALEARLAELADTYAEGEITKAEWMRARDKIEERLAKARRQRDGAALAAVTDRYAKAGALREAWPSMSIDQRRAVLGVVIDRVIIGPAPRPGQFDAERVDIAWRY